MIHHVIETGEQAGSTVLKDKFFVVEYNTEKRTRSIFSIHKDRAEAERNLELARAGKHPVQIEPGGKLGIE